MKINFIKMEHKKGAGSIKNRRDSNSKRLGIKLPLRKFFRLKRRVNH